MSWFKGVQTWCDWKDVNILWPKMCKRVVTERLWIIINEMVQMDLNRKDMKHILTERVQTDQDRDRKGKKGLWLKGCIWSWSKDCKWLWPKGCEWFSDRKCKRVMAKGCKWSWPKRLRMGCDRKNANGSWQKKCEQIVIERVWKECNRKGVKGV